MSLSSAAASLPLSLSLSVACSSLPSLLPLLSRSKGRRWRSWCTAHICHPCRNRRERNDEAHASASGAGRTDQRHVVVSCRSSRALVELRRLRVHLSRVRAGFLPRASCLRRLPSVTRVSLRGKPHFSCNSSRLALGSKCKRWARIESEIRYLKALMQWTKGESRCWLFKGRGSRGRGLRRRTACQEV